MPNQIDPTGCPVPPEDTNPDYCGAIGKDCKDFRSLRVRVAELELTLTIQESAHLDDLREIESLKDKLREIYRLRGEDPVVAGICNRALA